MEELEYSHESAALMVEAAADQAYDRGFRDGIIEGITKYAWWKDGVQYVGTCGTTLKDAKARALKELKP